jgi:hypothetical protein
VEERLDGGDAGTGDWSDKYETKLEFSSEGADKEESTSGGLDILHNELMLKTTPVLPSIISTEVTLPWWRDDSFLFVNLALIFPIYY